jgi:type IV fimbrial biogenesis protein FimT
MSSISHSTHRRQQSGFTLIELMIVVVITAVLMTAFAPGLRGAMARNQLLGQAHELAGAMSTARSEAITRGTQAGICASANGTSCSGSVDDWGKFILVFIDSDNGSDFDNTEPLLKSFTAHNQVSQSASVAAVYFRPSGFSSLNTASNIDVCHTDLDESSMCRRVTVGASGIVSVTTVTVTS